MRKTIFSIFASLLLFPSINAQRFIEISNTTNIDRKGELVEVKVKKLKSCFDKKTFVLKNADDIEIAYQIVFNEKQKAQSILFQADVLANSKSVYSLTEGKPMNVEPLTFARFIPERKDDFAWENDFAAYRMYGPALVAENPSNGVDFWAKKTNQLIVDEFYSNEIKLKKSYHVDHGKGLDFYKVAHTLGCGGIAPYSNNTLWVGNHYDTYKIIEQGPLRTVFQLVYDSVKVNNEYYKQLITITTAAGSLLNKADVTYIGKSGSFDLATGIFLHDGKGVLAKNDKNNVITYAEDAFTDVKLPSIGRNYVGVYSPNAFSTIEKSENHALLLSKYKTGKVFTYYFGGGWCQWKFKTDSEWKDAVNAFAKSIEQPLVVKVK